MEMTAPDLERATRVELAGKLDSSGAAKLDLPLAALVSCGGVLIVDMTRLEFIALIAVRHLVLAAKALARGRGRLVLLDPNPMVTSALRTAGVDDILPIFRSEDEAYAALNWHVSGRLLARGACTSAC
jgi:anti-anti-sigma factor